MGQRLTSYTLPHLDETMGIGVTGKRKVTRTNCRSQASWGVRLEDNSCKHADWGKPPPKNKTPWPSWHLFHFFGGRKKVGWGNLMPISRPDGEREGWRKRKCNKRKWKGRGRRKKIQKRQGENRGKGEDERHKEQERQKEIEEGTRKGLAVGLRIVLRLERIQEDAV